jgi:hypothetical protein
MPGFFLSGSAFPGQEKGPKIRPKTDHAGQKPPAWEENRAVKCLIRQCFMPTRAKIINFLLHGRKQEGRIENKK